MSWLRDLRDKEPPEPMKPIGIIVIGNLAPDRHDLPKEKVRKALKREQFKTVNLGVSVSPEDFLSLAFENKANIIAISINTNKAKENLEKFIGLCEPLGPVLPYIIIGGSAVTIEDARKYGIIYGDSAEEAVKIAKSLVKGKKE